jgi:glutathione S-transferase
LARRRKCSFADLAWISWQVIVTEIIQSNDGYTVQDYPQVKDWRDRMMARLGVKKGMADIYPDT